jgi:hypothetical protein
MTRFHEKFYGNVVVVEYLYVLVELDGTNPFTGKGRIALGKWQPPPDGSGDQPFNEGFEGCIDELRIWDHNSF